MHLLENIKKLLQSQPVVVPAICDDTSLALFVCPPDTASNHKDIQRFALRLAPETALVNAYEKCPLKITHDLTNNRLALCIFDGSTFKDISSLSVPNVDQHNIEQALAHLISSEVFNAASFYSQCTNQEDANFKKCQILLSCFTPKDKRDVSLEDIVQQANAACKKLETNTAVARPHPLRKNDAADVDKENLTITTQDNSTLKAKITALEQELALSEQVLKDSADSLTAIKRNNLFAGAAAGAASMLISVYCLDKDGRTPIGGKLAAATIGFTLGLIPYTRYATIAAAPLIVQKLIDSDVLSKKSGAAVTVETQKKS